MPLLNALIKPTVMKYSMRIYLKTSEKFEKLQKTGSRFTTKKDHTVSLAEYRLETIEHSLAVTPPHNAGSLVSEIANIFTLKSPDLKALLIFESNSFISAKIMLGLFKSGAFSLFGLVGDKS